MTFPHSLMAPVVELALKAGEAILPFWRANVLVNHKADESPVTAADMAAHDVLVAGLAALAPDIQSFPKKTPISRKACGPAGNAGGWWTRWMAPRNSFPVAKSSPSTLPW